MTARAILPTKRQLEIYLARVDESAHSRDNLFPVLVEKLYKDGRAVTGEQVGTALLEAIAFYLNRLAGQAKSLRRQLMKANVERYLWAISHDFEGDDGQAVLDDAVRYCKQYWDSVVA